MVKLLTLLNTFLFVFLLSTPYSHAQQVNGKNHGRNKLPEIGAAGFSALSIDKEQLIGNAMMKHLRASQPIVNDPVLIEYINDLGNRMVRNAQDVHYNFEFFLVNNKELNAFAFFGGHIGIHTGLITTAETESELASVVAHEISHVTQRHLARKMEAQNRNQPLTMAGMISGVLLTLINPTVGMAALSTSMAASQQASINYTRTNEKEADRVGIQLLANSGFDPMGAPNFFSKMAEQYRYKSKPPAMLLTHPLPESRISEARVRAQNFPARQIRASLQFELAKARLKARYEGNAQDNIKRYLIEIEKQRYVYKEAAQYGLAIAYFENENYEKSHEIIKSLLTKDQNNLFYIDLFTDLHIKVKNFPPILERLEKLNLLMPNNQVVALNYANALNEAENYQAAEILLQDFLLVQPNNFIAHDLLTDTYKKQNKMAMMHATKAEVFALLGAYPRAIDELQTGYNYADDKPLVKKRIKARIIQLQEQENKLKRLN
ncbi:M48 family metalloprotease [Thalassotalea sp. SU-HH00458]